MALIQIGFGIQEKKSKLISYELDDPEVIRLVTLYLEDKPEEQARMLDLIEKFKKKVHQSLG